jgi:hypothetical protein
MENPFPPECARRFRVERQLASGGYGTVYLAQQIDLQRPVAIKLLNPDSLADPDLVARFENEARITATLSHPHIVVLIDYGLDEGIPWIAYEYILGARSLRDRLREGPIHWIDALKIGNQVVSALAEAHARGVLHRDIKPDNVLEVDRSTYKVADFGIAKSAQGAGVRTEKGLILGTPTYLAPERIRGQPPTAQSDVYSSGILLYELLTGQVPFQDENPLVVLQRHLHEEVRPPGRGLSAVPDDVDRIVLKAVAKDTANRYASARTMSQDIERLIHSGPGNTSLDPSSPPAFRKRRSRHTRPVPTDPGPMLALRRRLRAVLLTVSALLLGLATGWVIVRRLLPAIQVRAASPALQPPATPVAPPARAPAPGAARTAAKDPPPAASPPGLAPAPVPAPVPAPGPAGRERRDPAPGLPPAGGRVAVTAMPAERAAAMAQEIRQVVTLVRGRKSRQIEIAKSTFAALDSATFEQASRAANTLVAQHSADLDRLRIWLAQLRQQYPSAPFAPPAAQHLLARLAAGCLDAWFHAEHCRVIGRTARWALDNFARLQIEGVLAHHPLEPYGDEVTPLTQQYRDMALVVLRHAAAQPALHDELPADLLTDLLEDLIEVSHHLHGDGSHITGSPLVFKLRAELKGSLASLSGPGSAALSDVATACWAWGEKNVRRNADRLLAVVRSARAPAEGMTRAIRALEPRIRARLEGAARSP